MPEPTVHTRRAHAKVNLALAVGPLIGPGQPNAGYHPICSWMHAIDLWDDVAARPLAAGSASRVSVEWASDASRPTPIDWPIEKDLAARAHRELEGAAARALPVELRVRKRIPVGSGLGGGSSDAAAVLMLLNDVFGLGLGTDRLAEIGRGLGSDVPYFVDPANPPRPAVVSGLGDRIERAPRAAADLWLIVPAFGCATGAVYGAFDRLVAGDPRSIVGVEAGDSCVRAIAVGPPRPDALFNDLASAAELVEPRLADVRRRAASAAGRPVHLTGSGSVVFVVGTGSDDLGPRLARAIPEAAIVPTRLV